MSRRFALAATAATLLVAPAAHADVLTLGSDLSAPATIVEAHQADTAFWPTSVGGTDFTIPADGQVLAVKVKGTVLKQPGAADPATMIHIQSLEPAAADGSRQVWLTSQAFDMPIDQPDAVTTFSPENLCVHQGGSVSFNDIGGFRYPGSLALPPDPDPTHYPNGAPFQVFGAVRSSSTSQFTMDNGTKNGNVLVPTARQGEELLMQVVLATGQDRSEPCGGPRRHPDGTLVVTTRYVPPAPKMHIADQVAYVSRTRGLGPTAWCPGNVAACTGTATLSYKGKAVARASFTAAAHKTAHIAMKLTPAAWKLVAKARKKGVRVTFAITSALGNYAQTITIRH